MTENSVERIVQMVDDNLLPQPDIESLTSWLQKFNGSKPIKEHVQRIGSDMTVNGYSDYAVDYILAAIGNVATKETPPEIHKSHDTDPDELLKKAKELVRGNYYDIEQLKEESFPISLDEIYIVWFSKTLQNWKALLSTTRKDAQYFEVTYDGKKKQTYVDTYVKIHNVCVPDNA